MCVCVCVRACVRACHAPDSMSACTDEANSRASAPASCALNTSSHGYARYTIQASDEPRPTTCITDWTSSPSLDSINVSELTLPGPIDAASRTRLLVHTGDSDHKSRDAHSTRPPLIMAEALAPTRAVKVDAASRRSCARAGWMRATLTVPVLKATVDPAPRRVLRRGDAEWRSLLMILILSRFARIAASPMINLNATSNDANRRLIWSFLNSDELLRMSTTMSRPAYIPLYRMQAHLVSRLESSIPDVAPDV
jgi:hypothetical protein